jgi:hypothetical protein
MNAEKSIAVTSERALFVATIAYYGLYQSTVNARDEALFKILGISNPAALGIPGFLCPMEL